MKERILLFSIIAGLGIFIYIFQSFCNTTIGLAFVILAIFVYTMCSTLAYKLKTRKLKKHPVEVNQDYKPFISIMVPAHNEDSVIANTIENILQIDYEKFESDLSDANYEVVNSYLEYKEALKNFKFMDIETKGLSNVPIILIGVKITGLNNAVICPTF